MSIEHSVIGAGEIHIAANWTVANAADLAALTLTTADVGKVAYQQDTKTVLLLLSSSPVNWLIVNPIVQPDHTTALLSGGQVSYQGNLDFLVTAATYEILGVPYSSAQTTLTLGTADVTNPRIDAIVLDNTGTAVVVPGTAASTPSTPYIDPSSQLEIATVTVPANATSITAATNTLLYDENAGTPTEWAATGLSGSWDFANTTAPLNGTKDILGAAITAGQTMQLAAASPVDLSTYVNGVLVLPVRVVSSWGSGRGIGVTWFAAGVQKGITISVQDGVFGFSRTLTSAYQYVVIPLVQFGVLPGVTVDQLRIAGFGGTIALRLDWIRLQGSAVTTVINGGGITQAQADARYFQIANNLSEGVAATIRTNISAALSTRSIATTAPLTGGGNLTADRTLAISDFTGDTGTGGAKGAVPAPAAGDAAANKFLAAGGGWGVPSGTGAPSTAHYVTTEAESGLSAEFNLGGLSSGMLKHTVAASVSTPATATAGTDYAGPPDGTTLEDNSGSTRIKDAGVTYAKIQNVSATDKVLGRSTAGAGSVEEIACTAAGRALIDDADAATQRTTLGLSAGGVQVVLGDGTNAITTSEPYIDLVFPFAVTLASWELTADASGAIELSLWKCTYAQYDAGSTHPVSGDNICASAPPIITASATKQNSGDTPMTGWTTAVSAGDRIRVKVTSATTVKRVTFALVWTR